MRKPSAIQEYIDKTDRRMDILGYGPEYQECEATLSRLNEELDSIRKCWEQAKKRLTPEEIDSCETNGVDTVRENGENPDNWIYWAIQTAKTEYDVDNRALPEQGQKAERLTVGELRTRRVSVSELAKEYGLTSFDTAMPIGWARDCIDKGFNPVGSVVWSYERNKGFGEAFPLTVEAVQELARIFPGIDIPPVPGKAPFDPDRVADYISSHGFGEPTEDGLALAETLYKQGDDYSTIGHEVVSRGLTADLENDEGPAPR